MEISLSDPGSFYDVLLNQIGRSFCTNMYFWSSWLMPVWFRTKGSSSHLCVLSAWACSAGDGWCSSFHSCLCELGTFSIFKTWCGFTLSRNIHRRNKHFSPRQAHYTQCYFLHNMCNTLLCLIIFILIFFKYVLLAGPVHTADHISITCMELLGAETTNPSDFHTTKVCFSP